MPKTQRSGKDTNLMSRIDEWNTRFAHECGERMRLLREPLNQDGGLSRYLFELYDKEIAKLPSILLDMKLCDFIARMEDNKPAETPMTNWCRSGPRGENKENIVAGGHCLRNTRARGGREQESSMRHPIAPVPIATTTRRAPKNGRLLVANTPMGPMRLPPTITPKVRNGGDLMCRALKPEEVAFSVTGTPVLADSAADGDAQHIAQMLQVDESQLTPETRGVVQGLKTVIRKMHENA